jgi:coproporphyrinogen III oxidase
LLLWSFQRKKHLLQRRERKVRRIWVRKWLQRRNENRGMSHLVFNELEYEDLASFRNFTRMSVATFYELLSKVAPKIKKQDTVLRETIPAKQR